MVIRPVLALTVAAAGLCVWGSGGQAALADHTCLGMASTIHGTDGPDVIVGTSGDDVISGLGGSDQIDGLAGNDSICGGGGWDYLIGGEGNDSLDGGTGDDTLIGGFHTDSLNGGANTDTCDPEPGADGVQNCEIVQVPAARFEPSVTSCGGTCAELLMTIVNVSGPPVGEAIIGNSSAGTVLTGGLPPPVGWQELGGNGDIATCFTEGTTFLGAGNSASAVQPGASLPFTSYQMEPDPQCASHTNLWYWQVGTLDGGFIEDGAFTINDTDGDSYFDAIDNCPLSPNPTQTDSDGDLAGNACDAPGSGNVDCSGPVVGVTSVDALKVLRANAGLAVAQSEPCLDIGLPRLLAAPDDWKMGDVDCSGWVNSADALKILRAVAGLSVAKPVGCPEVKP